MEEKEQQGAEASQEVQEQQSDTDDATSSFLQAYRDTTQAIRGFGSTEGTLHLISVTDVLIFLFVQLTNQILVLGRFPKSGTGQADPMLFAERERLPVAVNFVRQNALRPAAIAVMIAVYSFPKVPGLIVRLEVQPLDVGIPIHQAYVQLRPDRKKVRTV